ncbi:AAA family ATPase [Evansella sp. AB-P1]|uniref:AAA family ATPase n=1 Tax=Evansella sp. AB-P1 TaxID=3037653 RepID=UPI00241EB5B8|nr:AAA family ATPase [Evansella sp. AB-P1]MDG5789782.1 AAA family ATPase [Evansella sp. AB-P1]
MKIIDAIFFKKITPGDLWNIDRAKGTVAGGGGQTYINLAIDEDKLIEFLEYGDHIPKTSDHMLRNIITINADTIGQPLKISDIEFDPRQDRNDYKLSNQAIHKNRHHAWSNTENGFPVIPTGAVGAASVTNVDYLQIYIIRTTDGEYHAGYIDSSVMPTTWPKGVGLEEMFTGNRTDVIFFDHDDTDIPREVEEILEELRNTPNVLLYGPPGTGKTFAMQWLWEHLKQPAKKALIFKHDFSNPFELIDIESPLKFFQGDNRLEWLTFHQNLSYEEFVIGKQMEPVAGGFTLVPKLGTLMDLAVSIDPKGQYKRGILFIDELNRGNVSRIFGQVLTFLDADKRKVDENGYDNSMKLPIPLPELKINADKTEEVILMDGNKFQLPYPYYFPFPIYIIASMNSVDRAVAPLDTALARRFKKIEFAPSYEFIERHFEIDTSTIDLTKPKSWDSKVSAYLLLKRVNDFIADMLGKEFELGHSYILDVGNASNEKDGFKRLASSWEGLIMPQLFERFANKESQLYKFLKIEDAISDSSVSGFYPYTYRERDGHTLQVIEMVKLKNVDSDKVAEIMRFLAK